MSLLLWIVRILVILLLIRMVLRMLFPRGIAAGRGKPQAIERSGGTLVRDPQCGTYVPESRAVTIGRGETMVHFCSAACRDAWTAARRRPA